MFRVSDFTPETFLRFGVCVCALHSRAKTIHQKSSLTFSRCKATQETSRFGVLPNLNAPSPQLSHNFLPHLFLCNHLAPSCYYSVLPLLAAILLKAMASPHRDAAGDPAGHSYSVDVFMPQLPGPRRN